MENMSGNKSNKVVCDHKRSIIITITDATLTDTTTNSDIAPTTSYAYKFESLKQYYKANLSHKSIDDIIQFCIANKENN